MQRLENLVKIGEAAKIRGVSIDTLRRWERSAKLKAEKTD
ncbi:MerR family DNA-binding transcriptional regulator [Coleofasciculus sp. G2-EDA-02]